MSDEPKRPGGKPRTNWLVRSAYVFIAGTAIYVLSIGPAARICCDPDLFGGHATNLLFLMYRPIVMIWHIPSIGKPVAAYIRLFYPDGANYDNEECGIVLTSGT